MIVVQRYCWAELQALGGDKAVAATSLLAYLDDLTIVTETEHLEVAILALQEALRKARLIENETKGTVWTKSGQRPDSAKAARLLRRHPRSSLIT